MTVQSHSEQATLAVMESADPTRPSPDAAEPRDDREPVRPPSGILAVRRGPGANCSSIGSAVEMLFISATIGAAVLAAISAALRPLTSERVDAHAGDPPPGPPTSPPHGRGEPDPTEAG